MDVCLGLEIMTVAIETIDGPYKEKIEEILEIVEQQAGYLEIPVFESIEKAIFHYEYGVDEDEGLASVDGDLYYIYWDVFKEDQEWVPLLLD